MFYTLLKTKKPSNYLKGFFCSAWITIFRNQ